MEAYEALSSTTAADYKKGITAIFGDIIRVRRHQSLPLQTDAKQEKPKQGKKTP
jgi:hypothetical protein